MKLTILIINNLGIGINLLNYILQETDNIFVRNKDGTQNLNLTWRNLIAFEGLALILNNPHLIQVFSQSALTVGKTVLVQIFESLMSATQGDLLDLNGEGSQKHMNSPYYSQQKTPKFVEAQQVLDVEIPAPSSAQIHKLIIECICCFVENVIIIFDFNGFKIGANKQPQHRK